MSYLKEIGEAHYTIRGFITFFLAAPFWYLSIYLFDRHLYEQDLIIKTVFCACISLIYGFTFFIARVTLVESIDKEKYSPESNFYITTIVSVTFKSLFILLFYSLLFFKIVAVPYYWYVLSTFSVHIVTLIIAWLVGMKKPAE